MSSTHEHILFCVKSQIIKAISLRNRYVQSFQVDTSCKRLNKYFVAKITRLDWQYMRQRRTAQVSHAANELRRAKVLSNKQMCVLFLCTLRGVTTLYISILYIFFDIYIYIYITQCMSQHNSCCLTSDSCSYTTPPLLANALHTL